MGFEFVGGYVRLASGLSDFARTRARWAAQSLLSLPAAGIVNGSKMAAQAGFLAEELLTTAAANRSNVSSLIRSEMDVAMNRMGLVSVRQLEEAQAEAARLRTEVARLRSASASASASASPVSPRPTAGAAPGGSAKRSASKSSTTAASARTSRADRTTSRSAVTTRSRPAHR